jgi:hypothetical protein
MSPKEPLPTDAEWWQQWIAGFALMVSGVTVSRFPISHQVPDGLLPLE